MPQHTGLPAHVVTALGWPPGLAPHGQLARRLAVGLACAQGKRVSGLTWWPGRVGRLALALHTAFPLLLVPSFFFL